MKVAIGCLIQWYELDIIEEYFSSIRRAIDVLDDPSQVIVDNLVCLTQQLEQSDIPVEQCLDKIASLAKTYDLPLRSTYDLVTIADYRRQFNEEYCDKADVLIWGESDMIAPSSMFAAAIALHEVAPVPKYVATFAICKMWDESWKPLEHPQFTDKPFIEGDTTNWWSLRYTMSWEEMEQFNKAVSSPEVVEVRPHKFNGCGLVISSEVIKAGVNIPRSVFFIHEDTAFMLMVQKVLGQIPQYHFRDILLVHNRKHPNKRKHIAEEVGIDPTNPGLQRAQQPWYGPANKLCEQNCHNLFNPNYKAYTWADVVTVMREAAGWKK